METALIPSSSSHFACGPKAYRFVDINQLLGSHAQKLPVVLRLLFENEVRHSEPSKVAEVIERFAKWLNNCTSNDAIEFRPSRMLMEDTTSTPAFVDIAAMRDAVFEAGGNPEFLHPVLPIDASMDHSIVVQHFAVPNAAELNLAAEFALNGERFKFLRWVSREMSGVTIHPPGTGIMHTLNLEQLASVVSVVQEDGVEWAIPDTVVGTDSHTPLINGAGVLGWGIGGLEAQATMFGAPIILRMPDVVGVRFSGKLPSGILATDLALEVTRALRERGVSSQFVEFFGPGVISLSVGERCVVASMAPEYGASTGYFPIDENTLSYFRQVGRSEDDIALIEGFAKASGLWFDATIDPSYSQVIEIDLSAIRRCVAGPRRPHDWLTFGRIADSLPTLPELGRKTASGLPRLPIAIAAITSCTNTTDPALLITAGLLARKAVNLGLTVPPWVKTSLAPGSPAARSFLDRCGLLSELSTLGFDIVGYGCTTCIGNSGRLPDQIIAALESGSIRPVAALSGNRNFPGRVHPDIDLSFIMSPPLVIALALAGDAEVDLDNDPVQVTSTGTPVFLKDLWPTEDEVLANLTLGLNPTDFQKAYVAAKSNPAWNRVPAPGGKRFNWDPKSTFLTRPPYATRQRREVIGKFSAYPLMVLGDDITTDHIAPGSAIPPDSFAADFLVRKGVSPSELGVFSGRRGNWEVMLRATFYNKSLHNLLVPDAPVGCTVHSPTGDIAPIFEVAADYQREGSAVVLVAGSRYGSGSSRDWAAKGPWLLGVRAVLAISIERIHRQNLIGMGILPLLLPESAHPTALAIAFGDRIEVNVLSEGLRPGGSVQVRLIRKSGQIQDLLATSAVETEAESELLRSGGIIPSILEKILSTSRDRDAEVTP